MSFRLQIFFFDVTEIYRIRYTVNDSLDEKKRKKITTSLGAHHLCKIFIVPCRSFALNIRPSQLYGNERHKRRSTRSKMDSGIALAVLCCSRWCFRARVVIYVDNRDVIVELKEERVKNWAKINEREIILKFQDEKLY